MYKDGRVKEWLPSCYGEGEGVQMVELTRSKPGHVKWSGAVQFVGVPSSKECWGAVTCVCLVKGMWSQTRDVRSLRDERAKARGSGGRERGCDRRRVVGVAAMMMMKMKQQQTGRRRRQTRSSSRVERRKRFGSVPACMPASASLLPLHASYLQPASNLIYAHPGCARSGSPPLIRRCLAHCTTEKLAQTQHHRNRNTTRPQPSSDRYNQTVHPTTLPPVMTMMSSLVCRPCEEDTTMTGAYMMMFCTVCQQSAD